MPASPFWANSEAGRWGRISILCLWSWPSSMPGTRHCFMCSAGRPFRTWHAGVFRGELTSSSQPGIKRSLKEMKGCSGKSGLFSLHGAVEQGLHCSLHSLPCWRGLATAALQPLPVCSQPLSSPSTAFCVSQTPANSTSLISKETESEKKSDRWQLSHFNSVSLPGPLTMANKCPGGT